jgi:hypothetical protein
MRCDGADVAAYFEDIKQLITGAPASIVYNVDEGDFHEWVDATRHRVIVSAGFTDDKIDVPISRTDSRASVIACIATDGHSLTPMVIVPRKTVEIELHEFGFVPNAYSFVWQENGFCTRLLFERWCFEVFPDTVERCRRLGYTGLIFLILDGFSEQTNNSMEDGFSHLGTFPIVIPLHSSDQVQPLDLGMFAVHKLESRRVKPHGKLTTQTCKIIKILAGWEKALTRSSVAGALCRAEIFPICVAEAGTLACHVGPEQATQVRDWSGEKSYMCLDRGTHLK